MKKLILISTLLISCGYPTPARVKGTNEYTFAYCDKEHQCFEAAKKVCPNGFTVTKYGNIRPERFVCD